MKEEGVELFTGVPDTQLKEFCAYLMDQVPGDRHIIAANEGNALAIAAGHHLATGRLALVYMQNSGLGNVVNPLTSLTDALVYRIPALLLIGWRGQPGTEDEPQHKKQGLITLELLETLGVDYRVLPADPGEAGSAVREAAETAQAQGAPFAVVVEKGTFASYPQVSPQENPYDLSREEAIEIIISWLEAEAPVVSTTGKISRELFEIRERKGEGHHRDFLTVGSMGHSSQIALGMALSLPQRPVYCLDGDGAVLMHMGSLATVGKQLPGNYKHVVLNNGTHDSVGGQPTAGYKVDFTAIAEACGYQQSFRADNREELLEKMPQFQEAPGPALLEVRVAAGARKDLGRPTTTPQENKEALMEFLLE